jgi:hypothetical protein
VVFTGIRPHPWPSQGRCGAPIRDPFYHEQAVAMRVTSGRVVAGGVAALHRYWGYLGSAVPAAGPRIWAHTTTSPQGAFPVPPETHATLQRLT